MGIVESNSPWRLGMGFFRDMPVRSKLLIGYCTVFIIAITLGGLIIYSMVQKTIEMSIENQLSNSNAAICNMVRTSADISIKNYLRAVAEDNRSIVEGFYQRYRKGLITEHEAQEKAREILLDQTIGKTGYIYCVNSRGIAAVHRNPGVQGHNWSSLPFVLEQIKRKEGFLTYEWGNPGELKPKPKALYMTYFQPWDWIISATSYQEEFIYLISLGEIKKSILGMRFGKTGYSYIIDGQGNLIVHPSLKGNILEMGDMESLASLQRILMQKTGSIVYDWRNPGEKRSRKKLVFLSYIPELDWIIGSSGYVDELYAPLYRIGNIINTITLVTLVLVLLFTLWISSVITSPIRTLIEHFSTGTTGDFSLRMRTPSQDEIGRLAHYFNVFMGKLQEYSNSLHEEIRGHKHSAAALRQSEERYRSLSDNTPDIIYEADLDLNITYLNKAGYSSTGYSGEDLKKGISIRDFTGEKDFDWTLKAVREGKGFLTTHKIRRKDGSFIIGENNGSVIFDEGRPVGLRGSIRDVTEKRKLEEQILQAQKMETIGTLAGGLAHDFNNVLAGITSTLSIMRFEMDKGNTLSREKLQKHIGLMERSGQRATEMVQQLLTLSRKREAQFIPCDLCSTVDHVIRICQGTFDKCIEIRTEMPPGRAVVEGDATQIEQVLLNLCVNSGHAMTIMRPDGGMQGGKLIVSLEEIHADEHFCSVHNEAEPGAYWKLSVIDTGVGMDSSTISKIFVPFFTTKDKGKGTGLGLSMVYTIVHQHNGFIDLYSEPGVGTTFNVYLPALKQDIPVGMDEKIRDIPRGEGLILVVDDEEVLRETASSILEECGYHVITAEDGDEGVRVFQERHQEIAAVILDLVMPKKSGDKAYLEMKRVNHHLKVLLASGFRQDERVNLALAYGINGFIQKPYTMEKLAQAVADLLRI